MGVRCCLLKLSVAACTNLVVLMVPELMGLTMGHEQSCPSYGYGSPCRSCICKLRLECKINHYKISYNVVLRLFLFFYISFLRSLLTVGFILVVVFHVIYASNVLS